VFDYSVRYYFLLYKIISNKKLTNSKKFKFCFIFTSDVGDTVLFSTFLLVFMKKVSSDFVVITSNVNKELLSLLFPDNNFIGIDYHKYCNSILYRYEKICLLSEILTDSSITPMRSRDYFLTDSVSMVVSSKKALSFVSDNSNRNMFEAYFEKYIYNEIVIKSKNNSHELFTYDVFLSNFNVDFSSSLKFYIALFRKTHNNTPNNIKDIPSQYAILNVGASMHYKKWDINNFVLLAEDLYDRYNIKSLFVGGPTESGLKGGFNQHIFIIDLILQTSFSQLIPLIINSKFVVSNDSFIGHYSAILGADVYILSGGGHFGRFLPYPNKYKPIYNKAKTIFNQMDCYNCVWNCKYDDNEYTSSSFPCIESITVSQVLDEIDVASDCNYGN